MNVLPNHCSRMVLCMCVVACLAAAPSGAAVLLPDDRLVPATVQDVRSGTIRVNIGELEPRLLSVETASEKGIGTLKPGDKLVLVINGQNDIIDFHRLNQPGWDRVVKGTLAQPLLGDQRWAVIRAPNGRLEPYEVSDQNERRQLLNLPVGAPALFLLDKSNTIIDSTFGDERALSQTLSKWSAERQ